MVYNPYTGEYEDEEDPYGATREDGGGNGGGSYSPSTGPTGSDYYPPTQTAPSGGAGSSQYTDSYGYGGDGYGGNESYDPSGSGEQEEQGTYGDYGSSNPTFHADPTGSMPSDPFGGLPGFPSTPRPARGSTGDTGDPFGENAPKTSSPSNTTSNNSTTNNYSLNSTSVGSESLSNALPPIASSTPAANPSDFTPQDIPQSTPRRMNPAGMDSSRNFPGSSANPYDDAPAPLSNPYDPDLGLSKSGNNLPIGGGRTMPTTPTPSAWKSISGMIGNLTGLDPSSLSALGKSTLGLTGVDPAKKGVERYLGLLQDTRRRPRQSLSNTTQPTQPVKKQRPTNPYDLNPDEEDNPYEL